MKKRILLSAVGAIMLSTQSYADTKYESYNYIGFGVETLTYSENASSFDKLGIYTPYNSSATITSPVYTSGSLINTGNYFDFSIDAASTLSPGQTEEDVQVDGELVIQNQYDAMVSDLKMLVHYKMNNNHRITFGPSYKMFSMKRYEGKYTVDDAKTPMDLNEERVSTLFGNIGYWYEHAPFSNGGMRVKASATYGQPLWRDVTNTLQEKVSFNETSGYNVNCSGYLGFELSKGLEAGFFAEYDLSKKDGTSEQTIDGETIYWPENELETFRYGISVVWNFTVK